MGVKASFESFLSFERTNAGQAIQRGAECGEDERFEQSLANLDSSRTGDVDVPDGQNEAHQRDDRQDGERINQQEHNGDAEVGRDDSEGVESGERY